MARTSNTGIPHYTIRFAAEEDTPPVLRFIRKLVEYEQLLGEMVADADEPEWEGP